MNDPIGRRLLAEYGAVLVAQGVTPPPTLIFTDENEVARWQSLVKTERATIGRFTIELQTPAMQALLAARAEAKRAHLDIRPRTRDAARRSYADTVKLWRRRIDAGSRHWVEKRRLSRADAARIRGLSPREQIVEILRLEKQGLYFSQSFTKPILDSSAPPGASQHLSMLALDIQDSSPAKVRAILARQDWFQTVPCDLPHFAYLGVAEDRLPSLGLKQVQCKKRMFWVPELGTLSSPPE